VLGVVEVGGVERHGVARVVEKLDAVLPGQPAVDGEDLLPVVHQLLALVVLRRIDEHHQYPLAIALRQERVQIVFRRLEVDHLHPIRVIPGVLLELAGPDHIHALVATVFGARVVPQTKGFHGACIRQAELLPVADERQVVVVPLEVVIRAHTLSHGILVEVG